MLTTTGCLRLCNSGLLARSDVHGSVSRGQLLSGTVLYLTRMVSFWDRSDAMYKKLLEQQPGDTSGPDSTSSRVSGSKVDLSTLTVPLAHNLINSTSVAPDVVIEVEGTQEARERGHVVIAIDNPDPDLQVKIVVRIRKGLLLVSIVLIVLI